MFVLQKIPFPLSVTAILLFNTYISLRTKTDIQLPENISNRIFLYVNIITLSYYIIFLILIFYFINYLSYFNLIYILYALYCFYKSEGMYERICIVLSLVHVMYNLYKLTNSKNTNEDNIVTLDTHYIKVNLSFFIFEVLDYFSLIKIDSGWKSIRKALIFLASKSTKLVPILLVTNVIIQIQCKLYSNFYTDVLLEWIFAFLIYLLIINYFIHVSIYACKNIIVSDRTYKIEMCLANIMISLFNYVYILERKNKKNIEISNILILMGYFYMLIINRIYSNIIYNDYIRNSILFYSSTIIFSLSVICISLSLIELKEM